MYQALYRKYRPSTFDDVVGQKIVVKTLENAIKNNKINHAYIFCGPRGTGKTSIAKIFAKTINCSNLNKFKPCDECDSCIQIKNNKSIDIIEIDAASNNGVDEIRELKNNVNLVPSTGKYKVYIIDEVHMLTTSAFNALLKTLEEPPKHVIFILATTEVHKIPQTVLSRCQKFDFKKLTNEQIKKQLSFVCEKENITASDSALLSISKIANGGMRDALSLLDQINAYSDGNITDNEVNEINGNINNEQMFIILNKIFDENMVELLTLFKQLDNEGKNLSVVIDSIVENLKNILIYMNDSEYFTDKKIIDSYEKIVSKTTESNIYNVIDLLLDIKKNIKFDNNKLLQIELGIIRISSLLNSNVKEENNILIDKKIKKVNTKEKIEKKEQITGEICELKRIRINNTLSLFNKKDTIDFKQKLLKIQDLIANQKYSSIISLIIDGELKAKGNEYLLFVYKNTSMEQIFNSNIDKIEQFLSEVYKEKYKVVAENEKQWNIIKKKFNKALKEKRKIYHFIEEKDIKVPEVLIEDEKENIETIQTPIDNMFKEIVKYNEEGD